MMDKDIKEKIKNHKYHKFDGLAPEGFILVPETLLDTLLEFDEWKKFKGDKEYLKKFMIEFIENQENND